MMPKINGPMVMALVIIASIIISVIAFVQLQPLSLTGPTDDTVEVWTNHYIVPPLVDIPPFLTGELFIHFDQTEVIDPANPDCHVTNLQFTFNNIGLPTGANGLSEINIYWEFSFALNGVGSPGTTTGSDITGYITGHDMAMDGPLNINIDPDVTHRVSGEDGDLLTGYCFVEITGWMALSGSIIPFEVTYSEPFYSSVFESSGQPPANVPPTVSITSIETNAFIGTGVQDPLAVLIMGETADPDGNVVDIYIGYGDGDDFTFSYFDIDSFGPTHLYPDYGTYTIHITVTDDEGASTSTDGTVVLNPIIDGPDPGPDPDNIPPTVSISITDSLENLTAPVTINFTGQASDSDGTIESYLWDFDDDTTSTEQNPSHTFEDNGSFEVSLRVIDNDGGSAIARIDIEVGVGDGILPGELSIGMIVWIMILFSAGIVAILIPTTSPYGLLIKIIILIILLVIGLWFWFFGIPAIISFGLVI